jgi:hypothetical protein
MELPLVPGASDLVILAHHHLQVDICIILRHEVPYMTFLTEKDRKLNFVTFCRGLKVCPDIGVPALSKRAADIKLL